VPLLRTNVKPARSKRVRVPLSALTMYSLIGSSDPAAQPTREPFRRQRDAHRDRQPG
jgi:hypothetical protein